MSWLIEHKSGDATLAPGTRPAAIIHVCNDIGAWGAGFVLALSARWSAPETAYRSLRERPLGISQVVEVEPPPSPLYVVNMVAQRGVSRSVRAVSYDALDDCLRELYQRTIPTYGLKEVHAPLFGAGLGGGDWEVIEEILACHVTVPTTIWHLL